jgi:predicted AAA+ superfamily ATPase
MWIQRNISEKLKTLALQRPVLLLSGCRQTGKTALLRHLFPSHGYVSLDLPLTAQEAEESGQRFLEKHPTPLIVDEIQYAPGMFRSLKHAVDQNRDQMGAYLLTGSQKFSLMEGVSDSLAGRVAIVELHSLSLLELEAYSQKKAQGDQLLEWMLMGGYPEVHARGLDPEQFYSSYLATYLERDVRQIIQVRDLRNFDRFIRLAAIRTGQLVSMNSLASDVGVSTNTIKTWLSVLEASNVICLLEPYYQNAGKRLVKTPKLYFLDTGLACFLAGIRTTKDLAQSALLGSLFETLALGQLIRKYSNNLRMPNIYFYRDHYGHEVDFVIPVAEKLKLFECKWSERPDFAKIDLMSFGEIERSFGPEKIFSKTIISPVRGSTVLKGLVVEDCVELKSLEV